MKLTAELVQPIVDKTIEILGRNVNIMNAEGIIIGSGQKERINTFHEAAAWVIKHKKKFEVAVGDIDYLEGVKPGVNLPIEVNGETVGVVGITGSPEEVRNFGELVRMTVQLMLQQTLSRELLEVERRAKDNLVFDLIFGAGNVRESDLLARCEVLGFDLNEPRHTLVVQFHDDSPNSGCFAIDSRHSLDTLFKETLSTLSPVRPFFAGIGAGRFVILSAGSKTKNKSHFGGKLPSGALKDAEQLQKRLEALTGFTVTVGIGGYYPETGNLQSSFREALRALETGLRLKGPGGLYNCENLGFAQLIGDVPEESRRRYVYQVLGQLNSLEPRQQKEILSTLEQFFAANLNITLAAQRLFIHRNTLLYRLNRIAELTGLDPRCFTSAVELQMAILLKKYNQSG